MKKKPRYLLLFTGMRELHYHLTVILYILLSEGDVEMKELYIHLTFA